MVFFSVSLATILASMKYLAENMTDLPNFKSEAALAFEREYDIKRQHLDTKLKRKLERINQHEAELKKLIDQQSTRKKPSNALERTITATKNTIKLVRKDYLDAVNDFERWCQNKKTEVNAQIEEMIEKRLADADVKLKSLKYDSVLVEADE